MQMKVDMQRFFFSLLLIFTTIYAPWWFFVLASFVYCLRFYGWEVIVLAGLIDAYYRPIGDWPLYTIFSIMVVVFAVWLRPYLYLRNVTAD